MSKRYLTLYLLLFVGGIVGLVGKLADNPDLRTQFLEGRVFVVFGGVGMLALVALTRDMLLRISLSRIPSVQGTKRSDGGATSSASRQHRDSPASDVKALGGRGLGWVWVVVIFACLVSVAVIIVALRAGWQFV